MAVRLTAAAPMVDESGRLDYELEDYFGFRWWSLPEIVACDSRFYPGRLAELVTPFLHGEHIDEPFQLWS